MFKIIIFLFLISPKFSISQSLDINVLSKEWSPILANDNLGNVFYEKTLIRVNLDLDIISYKMENKKEKFFKIKKIVDKSENDEITSVFILDDDEFDIASFVNGQFIFYNKEKGGLRFTDLVPLD